MSQYSLVYSLYDTYHEQFNKYFGLRQMHENRMLLQKEFQLIVFIAYQHFSSNGLGPDVGKFSRFLTPTPLPSAFQQNAYEGYF
jgi:hypothetical protein